jgi:hypothetical protein
MFEVSRRDLIIGAAGASAAFGLDKPLAFIGAAQAQTMPAGAGFKSYKVGDIEVISLYDGVWEKAHDENFIKGANVEQTKAALKAGGLTDAFVPIPFTTMAVKSPSGVVLIDTGTGGQTGGPKAGLMMQSMQAAGIDPTRMGGRGIGIHSLRKTAINDAIRNGATMHEVREFAGHADIRTTELYFIRKEEDAEVAARRIQIRLTGSRVQ